MKTKEEKRLMEQKMREAEQLAVKLVEQSERRCGHQSSCLSCTGVAFSLVLYSYYSAVCIIMLFVYDMIFKIRSKISPFKFKF